MSRWKWPGACNRPGHEVVFVANALGKRTDDVDVWRHAASINAIMVTCNRQDFLALAGTEPAAGLILVNRRKTRQSECTDVLKLIESAGESGLKGNINFA